MKCPHCNRRLVSASTWSEEDQQYIPAPQCRIHGVIHPQEVVYG